MFDGDNSATQNFRFFQMSKAQKASHVSKSLRFSAGGLTLIVWKQNVVYEKKVSDA